MNVLDPHIAGRNGPVVDLVERPRRLRRSPGLRSLVRETRLSADDFVYPLFVTHGRKVRRPITSMPGQFQLSVDTAVAEAEAAHRLGVKAVLLFGIPAEKDPIGLENFSRDGIVQQTVRELKSALPDLVVITDVCLCEYTDHGHCGVINRDERDNRLEPGYLLNDETLSILQRVAVSHADAGADVVAPSGMIDGMVAGIRAGLDENGFEHISILSYAVKYASSFYGPFRDAADGAPRFGDRHSHQMDPANAREALREADLDVRQGADILMVKPALPYLDIVARLRDRFPSVPLAAYQVSGEYAMLKAAAQNGWVDAQNTALESLTAIKRAGADIVITYFAREAAEWLQGH